MWKKLKNIWPVTIETPHIPLGMGIEDALKILRSISPEIIKDETDGELQYRVNSKSFDMAVYENNRKVSSVWYNDPSGRLTPFGKKRKIKLYLSRYGDIDWWEERINNGWMTHHFNNVDNVAMVYGNDKDVIRINEHIFSEDTDAGFVWRTDDITAEIKRDDEYLMMGNYLELNQALGEGEPGWNHTKLNIPETWQVIAITKDTENIYIDTKEHGKFILNSNNYGDVSSDLLAVSDEQNSLEVENIWDQYAKYN